MQQIQTQKNSIEHFFKPKVMLRFLMEISPNSLWLVDFAFFAFTLTNSPKISLNVDEKKKLTKNANINFDWMSFFFSESWRQNHQTLTRKKSTRDEMDFLEVIKNVFFFFLSEILKCFKVLAAIDHHRQHFGEI